MLAYYRMNAGLGLWLSGALVFAALGPSLHVAGPHLAAGITLTAGAELSPTFQVLAVPYMTWRGQVTRRQACWYPAAMKGSSDGSHGYPLSGR
jgi:hypothetical protein